MQEEIRIAVLLTYQADAADGSREQRESIMADVGRLLDADSESSVELIRAHFGRAIPESEIYGTNGQAEPLESLTLDPATIALNAACLWEAALDANARGGAPGSPARETAPAWVRDLLEFWENYGACTVREDVTRLAATVESGWSVAKKAGFDSPFDWEFCPWFLSACVAWDARTGGTLRPDYLDLCRAYGEADS